VAIPLYQRIAEDLVSQIKAGVLPVGTLLKSEFELMDAYGASRNTVRSALGRLQEMGLISRRRNRGTMVEALPTQGAYTQSMSTLEDLMALAQTAQREVHRSEELVLDIDLARLLRCPPGSRMLRIGMTRREPEAADPLVWTDAYVDTHYRRVLPLVKKHPDMLVCDLIEQHFGRRVGTVEQIVSACSIPAEVAGRLNVAAGEPGLRILRYYRDTTQAMVVATVSTYPAHRYSIATMLVRAK
jgi:DNA-binding GntR family transcriptional regulator